jgi:hypothetical protein
MHARIASAIPLPDRPDARVVLFHIFEALRRLPTAKKWHTCDSDWHISAHTQSTQVLDASCAVLLKIDRHDVVAETRAKLRNWNMLRIGLVSVERRPVAEFDHERGVVRPRRVDDVGADRQPDDAFDPMQPAQARTMILAD